MSRSPTMTLARANARAALFLARIAAAVLAVIALATFCDVIGRYFFKAPFSFTVELTEIGMAVLVYFGMGLVTCQDGHISADFLVSRVSPRFRALLAVTTNLLSLGFVGVLVWQLWLHAGYLFQKGDLTQNWSVPLWPVAFAVAFGSVFLVSGVLVQLITAWTILRGGRQPDVLPPPGQPSVPRLTE
jgi:TRAP-type C4-dicarboxylate transport system permease small subunit